MKKIIRKKLIKKRKKHYLEITSKHCLDIYKLIKKKYKNVNVIGGYASVNYEFDCLKLLKFLNLKKFTTCLPKIKKNYQMDFYKYSFNEPLMVNNLGITEPLKITKKKIPDLIFVPLVGFDNKLNRLGYGGGFYDRYFEKNLKQKNIIKIGLAFSFQKIKKLPINKFDKKLDNIITEKNLR